MVEIRKIFPNQENKGEHEDLPRVSVISIALSAEHFQPMRRALDRQSYVDFEFIGEVGGTIPEAWNRAIRRARGEILIFTETDAQPVNERWIEELVNHVQDRNTVVKGLEITEIPWDMSNLAGYKEVFLDNPFDEGFRWAEDSEIVCRLKNSGYKFIQLDCAPVIHVEKSRSRRYIRRAFRYGLYWARLKQRYPGTQDVAGLKEILKMLVKSCLNLIGFMVGSVVYFPERRKGK